MTTFNDRERAYEAHFALDQEQEFKAQVRRNRALGRWAGGQMGLTGEALDAYVQAVVKSDFQEAGDDDVLRKVMADLAEKKVEVTAEVVRQQMEQLLAVARAEVKAGT